MKRVCIALLVLALVPLAAAQYADLSFVVDDAGVTTVTGTTNQPDIAPGVHTEFTSKTNTHWLFNVTSNARLSAYVYSVTLPAGASVNYISGSSARITTEGGNVVVRGSGENEALQVTIQYALGPPKASTFATWLPLLVMTVLVLLVFIVARSARIRGKRLTAQTHAVHAQHGEHKSAEQRGTANAAKTAPTYLEGLPARQREIVELLRKAGGTLTQRQLEITLKIPKSSVSRNVEALRVRGLIEKAQIGMTNTIVLAEKYRRTE